MLPHYSLNYGVPPPVELINMTQKKHYVDHKFTLKEMYHKC
jgi:hypothetical protein